MNRNGSAAVPNFGRGFSIDWSSRIATLTAPGISISRRATSDLLTARIRLKRTLTHMEAHWKNLQREVKSRGDKVVELSRNSLAHRRESTSILG